MKSILIVDDDIDTSIKYKQWLEEAGFNLTLINDPESAENHFKPGKYDLVLVGFKMSVMDDFELYDRLHNVSEKIEGTPQEFRICFMTTSTVNYKALAEVHPDFAQECYVNKKVEKDSFINHVNSLIT